MLVILSLYICALNVFNITFHQYWLIKHDATCCHKNELSLFRINCLRQRNIWPAYICKFSSEMNDVPVPDWTFSLKYGLNLFTQICFWNHYFIDVFITPKHCLLNVNMSFPWSLIICARDIIYELADSTSSLRQVLCGC